MFFKFLKNLFADGYSLIGGIAPLLSIVFTLCKAFNVPLDWLRGLSYAWSLLPLLLWVIVAYIRRWYAHTSLVGGSPDVEAVFIKDPEDFYCAWYLELRSLSVKARYIVQLDFERGQVETNAGVLNAPVSGCWSGGSVETSREIISGGKDRIFIYGIEGSSGAGGYVSFYEYTFKVIEGGVEKIVGLTSGNSWPASSNPPSDPKKLSLKIWISAEPQLIEDPRVIEVEIHGHRLSIIKGNARIED